MRIQTHESDSPSHFKSLDPDFATNGYVYLGYTVAPWTAGIAGTGAVVTFNRIVRYTNLGTKADPTSRFIVIGKDYTDGYMSVCGSSHAFGVIFQFCHCIAAC